MNDAILRNDLDPLDQLKSCSDRLLGYAEEWNKIEAIEDEAAAQRAADLIRNFTAHEKEIDAQRKAEKEPHLAAGRAVDALYKPLLDVASAAKEVVSRLQKAWLKKKEAAKHAEEAAARRKVEEAAAVANKLFAEARTIAEHQRVAEAVATTNDAMAAADKIAARKIGVSGELGSRAMTLRRGPAKARITDPKAAAQWAWANHKDALLVEIERLASVDARAGVQIIPGCEIYREESVA